ncbi:MAG: ABC transporter permease [Devosia sp.]|nr:ABC transporter permease [Devosia sp.]
MRSSSSDIVRALFRQPSGAIGLAALATLLVVSVAAPVLAPFDPNETHIQDILAAPGLPYLLGTDELGRDLLSRLLHGGLTSMALSFAAVGVGGTLGVTTGLLAGYRGGVLDALLMRFVDALFAFPMILIGICAVIVLGSGWLPVGVAIAIGVTPTFARLGRAEVIRVSARDYVKASRAMGARGAWILAKHILPNILTPIVVQLTLAASVAIVMSSALDFLGLGAQPPNPSWGNMLQAGRLYLREAPLYAITPGVALTVFVISANLVSAALTNALDPKARTQLRTRAGRSVADSQKKKGAAL